MFSMSNYQKINDIASLLVKWYRQEAVFLNYQVDVKHNDDIFQFDILMNVASNEHKNKGKIILIDFICEADKTEELGEKDVIKKMEYINTQFGAFYICIVHNNHCVDKIAECIMQNIGKSGLIEMR